jgi:hypothetical protein
MRFIIMWNIFRNCAGDALIEPALPGRASSSDAQDGKYGTYYVWVIDPDTL